MDPLVRASGLRGYPALMRDTGHDPSPLLRRYHIAEEALDRDDALISLRSATHLLEASAAATGLQDFGLRLSLRQSIDILGPVSIVLRNAPTVKVALNDVIRYLFVHSPGIVVSLLERNPLLPGTVGVSIDIRLSGHVDMRQNIDLCLADAHNFLHLFAGDAYVLRAISLPHAPAAGRAAYERFFRAPLLEEPSGATLHIARETFTTDLQGTNSTLRHIAEDYIFRNFGSPRGSTSDRVRQVLRQTLGTSTCTKSDIASLLAMHPRTLQRRLSDENTNFEILKDAVRGDLAMHYLRNTQLAMGQIALMLGFPAQSELSRACRRWYGLTPTALRRSPRPYPPKLERD